MSRHTPGPWEWRTDPKDPEVLPILTAAGGEVLVCDFGVDAQYYPTQGFPPKPADAALIAAAPELLDALETIMGEPAAAVPHKIRMYAYAAIRKANGETP